MLTGHNALDYNPPLHYFIHPIHIPVWPINVSLKCVCSHIVWDINRMAPTQPSDEDIKPIPKYIDIAAIVRGHSAPLTEF